MRAQLAACVFYIVPRVDADGTEAVFAAVAAATWNALGRPDTFPCR